MTHREQNRERERERERERRRQKRVVVASLQELGWESRRSALKETYKAMEILG